MKNIHQVVMFITIIILSLTVAGSAYKYIYNKDYQMIVDVECNPEIENCFYIEVPDELPEYYKVLRFDRQSFNLDCSIEEVECYEEFCAENNCELSTCDNLDYIHKFDGCVNEES
jgi:hypothetical protein